MKSKDSQKFVEKMSEGGSDELEKEQNKRDAMCVFSELTQINKVMENGAEIIELLGEEFLFATLKINEDFERELKSLQNLESLPHTKLKYTDADFNHGINNQTGTLGHHAGIILETIENNLSRESVGKSRNIEEFRERWKSLFDTWKRYKLLCEDLAARRVNPKKIEKEFKDSDRVEFLFEILDNYLDKIDRPGGVEVNHQIDESVKDVVLTEKISVGALFNKIMNIMENSLQKEGFGAKNVTFHATIENNNLVMRVMDDGEGIPPEVIENIYKEKYTTRSKGTEHGGIGLAYADTIIASMGGEITVDTHYGDDNKGNLELEEGEPSYDPQDYNTIFEIKFALKKET
ncbi:sensor histidine kinase [Patescibacteria group bacterium]|nr:sensor histidine kinase [Patescibacteria group bacterium]